VNAVVQAKHKGKVNRMNARVIKISNFASPILKDIS